MNLLRFALRPFENNQFLFKSAIIGAALSLHSCGIQPNAAVSEALKEKKISTNVVQSQEPVCTVDRFRQPSPPVATKADILFVVDNSKSMYRHWQLMARGIGKLIHQLPKDQDVRFAVVLGTITKYPGVLFSAPKVPKVLDSKKLTEAQIMESLRKTFAYAMEYDNVDWKGAGEALFYSLYYAATSKAPSIQKQGFFRPDAALSVIFMSDDAEEGYPYPSKQVWDLPPKCNWSHHDKMRKTFYLPRGIDTDSTFAALKRLKGDMPLVTNAFVNITREDILVDNDLHAKCIFDSPGFGYFDMVKRTDGLLYSIHKSREKGLELAGKTLRARLDLLHDFKLSKPAEKVDPPSIVAKVDAQKVAHTYFADTNVVHLEFAGQAGSLLEIQHCEPAPQPEWTISGFTGEAAQTTANLRWNTSAYPTKGRLLFGTSPDALNDSVADPTTSINHSVALVNLNPNTTYYFQAIASDEFGKEKRSEIISLRTRPDWVIGQVFGQASRNSATLSWITSGYPTSGKVLWGTAPDQLTASTPETAPSKDHLVILEGLQPSTVYYFQAVSRDEFGLIQASPVISLRTAADWAVVGFTGKASRTTASLIWQTPEEITTGQLRYGLSPDSLSLTVNDSVIGNEHGVSLSGLEPGTDYYFQALAKDQNGNIKQSPVISLRTLNDWAIANLSTLPTETTISISFTTAGYPTNARVLYGLSPDQLTNSIEAGSLSETHEAAATNLSPNTPYYVQAVAIDDLQVERRSEVLLVRTKPIVTPLPKWVISGIDGSATTHSITINWETSDYPTIGQLRWGSSPDALSNTENEKEAAKSHSVTVNDLSPDSFYYFQIVARDDRGQEQASSVIAVRTQALPLPSWAITGFTGTPAVRSVSLQWLTTDYPTLGEVHWGLSPNTLDGVVKESVAGNNHSLQIAGLSPETLYYFQVQAQDDKGQLKLSPVISVRTQKEEIPLPSWEITALKGVALETSASITWDTSSYPTIGKVRWGLSALNLDRETEPEQDAANFHALSLQGLTPDTTYYFQAISSDDRGQTKESEVISVRTQALPLPVWQITDFAGTASANWVTVNWNTSDYPTIGKVRYGTSATNLDRETSAEKSPAKSHPFTLEGLNANTTYYFQAVSSDDRGQTRESEVISIKTQIIPPTWSIVGFDGTTTANQANLIWQTPSRPTKAVLKVGLSADNLTLRQIEVPNFNTSQVVGVSGLTPNTIYFFQVVAEDSDGGIVESEIISKKTKVR